MHPVHPFRFSLLILGTLAACEPGTSTGPSGVETPIDHALSAPLIDAADLVHRTSVTRTPPPGPGGPQASDVGDDFTIRPLQQVTGEHTSASFREKEFRLLARHSYIGNVGVITSTANVTLDGMHFTSQVSESQEYTPFIIDFGRVKRMFHETIVHLPGTCGFSGGGSSQHKAWWQFYQGRSAPEWGVVNEPSYAKLAYGPCERATGERGGTMTDEGGRVCTVLITYDLNTNEILNVEVLTCYRVSDNRM